MNVNPQVTIEVQGILKFESETHLQNVIEEMRTDKKLDLKSVSLLKKFNLSENLSKTALRSVASQFQFESLYDANYAVGVATLTPNDWAVINSDPEALVYVPEDQLIEDVYLTTVLNSKHEIQVNNTVYKYTDAGIYYTDAANASLLDNISNSGALNTPLNSEITLYVPQTASSSSSKPSLSGTTLKFTDGTTIPANQIRDVNFKDSDANFVTTIINKVLGRTCTAINNFSTDRKMLTTFYEQDYLIYKRIGVGVKFQKKVCFIWWNVNAPEIRIGWNNIELSEEFSLPNPFASIPKPVDFMPYLYPNLRIYEPNPYPNWLKKSFPYEAPDEHVLFPVPFTQYELTLNSLVNAAYSSGLSYADKSIKGYMKAYNLANTPKNMGLYTFENAAKMRYLLAPHEQKFLNTSSPDFKFFSEWFGGTYVVGYSTDPMSPSFKHASYSASISANPMKLKRGIVYGAVKYNNQWRAARIVKSE